MRVLTLAILLDPSFEVAVPGLSNFRKSLDLFLVNEQLEVYQNMNPQKQLLTASETYKSAKSQPLFLVFSALPRL
jgi:hypothetical protein